MTHLDEDFVFLNSVFETRCGFEKNIHVKKILADFYLNLPYYVGIYIVLFKSFLSKPFYGQKLESI